MFEISLISIGMLNICTEMQIILTELMRYQQILETFTEITYFDQNV